MNDFKSVSPNTVGVTRIESGDLVLNVFHRLSSIFVLPNFFRSLHPNQFAFVFLVKSDAWNIATGEVVYTLENSESLEGPMGSVLPVERILKLSTFGSQMHFQMCSYVEIFRQLDGSLRPKYGEWLVVHALPSDLCRSLFQMAKVRGIRVIHIVEEINVQSLMLPSSDRHTLIYGTNVLEQILTVIQTDRICMLLEGMGIENSILTSQSMGHVSWYCSLLSNQQNIDSQSLLLRILVSSQNILL